MLFHSDSKSLMSPGHIPSYYDIDNYELSLKTINLEKEYENTLGRTTHILDTERIRVHCMERLLLKFENDGLRLQLDQANELVKSKNEEPYLQTQLHETRKEVKRLRAVIPTMSAEIGSLRERTTSLNNKEVDYENLLAENIRISKDISSVQTENERLRAQSALHSTLLSEKQSLEKQLKSGEAQAEKEKHAHSYMKAEVSRQMEIITSVSGQLEKTQRELAEELRARETQKRSSDSQKIEWEAERAAYEDKLQSVNEKLHSIKDELQETRRESQSHRRNEAGMANDSALKPQRIPLQRPADNNNHSVTIATPGAIKVRQKTKKSSALPGDKSAFSITPLLNRTGAPPASSTSSADEMDEPTKATDNDEIKPSSRAKARIDGGTKAQYLNRSGEGRRTNTRTKHTAASKEDIPSRPPDHTVNEKPPTSPNFSRTSSHGQVPAKPKRRKLGAQRDKNMFDDENDELSETRQPVRKLAIPGGLQSSMPVSTGFSPLKRDRRLH